MTPSIDPKIAMQAAMWMVEIEDEDVPASHFDHLQQWRNADPEHERAWLHIEHFRSMVRGVPSDLGMTLLGRPRPQPNRRAMLGALAFCLSAPAAAWMVGGLPWHEWNADYRTATGQQSAITLADGSRLTLNTATSADVAFDARQRLVRLRSGELMVSTAADSATPSRPFRVQTREGMLRALGTRFSVRQQDGFSHLAVFDGAVEVNLLGDAIQPTVVKAGEQCTFSASGLAARGPVADTLAAWASGVIVANDMRLGDFVAELARYRTGVLQCDPAVAQRSVSGTFQLKDTDQALSLIAQTLNVRVERRTRFWVTVKGPTA